MGYRFRAVKISTNDIKDAWFGVPELVRNKKDPEDCPLRDFKMVITPYPDQALIAENESQAFFMFTAMKDALAKEDIRLIMEVAPETPKDHRIKNEIEIVEDKPYSPVYRKKPMARVKPSMPAKMEV